MNNIIMLLFSATLFACSAKPVQEHSFYISFAGQEGSVEGSGSTPKDAAKDALRYMQQNVWKGRYVGLKVDVRDEDSGEQWL